MVLGSETNIVCLSGKLHSDGRFTKACNALTELLEKHGVRYEFLKATKDIWCRDYMPLQIGKEEFVQFRYEPSYLKDNLELQSNPEEVCKANNIVPRFSKINLDGGNGLDYVDIPFLEHKEKKYPDHAIGCYVNYLEVENLIVLPIFEIDNNKDKEAYDTFRQISQTEKLKR